MSKYDPLEHRLREIPAHALVLTFAEVEEIIGTKLPTASYTYEEHWRGSTTGRPGGAIAAAGWHVAKIDLGTQVIDLRRRRGSAIKSVPPTRTRQAPKQRIVQVQLPPDSWQSVEVRAARYFSGLWKTPLGPRTVEVRGVRKKFDLVSSDGRLVGDVKTYTNIPVPAAKWSTIAEYVWLLQHVVAERRFLVFGGDGEVARRFLARWRAVTQPVEFYLLTAEGHLKL